MQNLLFETFGEQEFNLRKYFIFCFNKLPSGLYLDNLPLKLDRKSVEELTNSIDLLTHDFKIVFKSWFTKDIKSTSISEDFPWKIIYKSSSQEILFELRAYDQRYDIEFLYSSDSEVSEKWVLETNDFLRNKFAETDSPKFRVLAFANNNFKTRFVKTNDFKIINISENYNDDFLKVDEIISTSLEIKKSGMILLHGNPGTGKTTYIKHLISKFSEKNFIFVQNEFVEELLKPSFVEFLLNNKDCILIIEDAEKVIISREKFDGNSIVSTLLQLTDGLLSDFLNVKIICTFNIEIDQVDKALLRKGRLISLYQFGPLSIEKTKFLADKLGINSIEKSLTLAEIFNFNSENYNEIKKRKIGFESIENNS